MLDLKPIQDARLAAARLADALIENLETPLWDAELGPEAREAQDYVIGAVRAVGNDLANVAVHLRNYRQLRFAQDREQVQNVRTAGRPYPVGGDATRYNERDLELGAAVQALLVSIGSVMDCLAPAIVGLTGIGLDLRRVDFGSLLPRGDTATYPAQAIDKELMKGLAPTTDPLRGLQVSSLRGLVGAIAAAGPDGWLAWTLGMRNMWVHREHRAENIVMIGKPPKLRMARLPASNPDVSNMQALKYGEMGLYKGFYLEEDLLRTFDGVVGSLNLAVQTMADILQTVLRERVARPALTRHARLVWRAPANQHRFAGYEPGSSSIDTKKAAMLLPPGDIKRMTFVGLIKGV